MNDTNTTELDTNTDEMKGKFFDTLKRSNRQIKNDRAIAIAEATQIKYKRRIEDLETEYKDIRRERANMMDISPSVTTNIITVSDFKADDFVTKDIEMGVKLRNIEIQLEIAKASYKNLFE